MGFFDRLVSTARLEPEVYATPWVDANATIAEGLVYAEVLGFPLDGLPLDRAKAVQVPAIARARNLIVSTIAPLPLRAVRDGAPLAEQPGWLSASEHIETPYDRMAWTVDDLFFHGLSLWGVNREGGRVVDAARVPYGLWRIREGRVEVKLEPNGTYQRVTAEDVILFTHPSHGMLVDAADTIRAARAIEAAYISRARNPIPLTVIEHVPGTEANAQLAQAEITSLLAQWRTARQSPDGALGYLPPTLRMSTPGTDATDMLQEARNACRIDIANHSNLPVTLIDGGVSQESMTYRNGNAEVSRYYVEGLPYWADPIVHRLSRADVEPEPGTAIRFDLSAFDTPAPSPTGVPTDD